MKIIQTEIPDVVLIEPRVFEDERGFFFESFNEENFFSALAERGLQRPRHFVQDNHSCSSKGVLRGLHYQKAPNAQGKLVRVVSGSVFDVAVDIREGSPTLGKWVGVELNAKNKRMLWIPEGFAHGFVVLEDNTHFLYKTTNYYSKDDEVSIVWDDVDIGVRWPVEQLGELTISEKDANAPAFKNVTL